MKTRNYKKPAKDHLWREHYPNSLEAEAERKKALEFIEKELKKKEKK